MQVASNLFSRLTEVEKTAIRGASKDRLDYLADTSHRVDFPNTTFDERSVLMEEVAALCALEFASKGSQQGFEGVTWKF